MSEIHDPNLHVLHYYLTASYPCSYIDGRTARSRVVAPGHLVNDKAYASLLRVGFRRSGLFTYKPQCDNCQACISVRINTFAFKPGSTQKRILKRHHDLSARKVPMQWQDEHFMLYSRYQHQRGVTIREAPHNSGSTANFTVQTFKRIVRPDVPPMSYGEIIV